MRHFFYCDTVGPVGSVGLVALRLVMGAAFILHGWPKIQHPTAWMGAEASVPAFLQVLAAAAEFGGGMALVAGLLTRLAAPGYRLQHDRGAGHGPHSEGRSVCEPGRPLL